MDAITIKNVSKKYNDSLVVNNFSLNIPQGSIFGFVGKNGAGKSTTQKMVCGLTYPTSGEIKIFGKSIADKSTYKNIGAIIEQPGIYSNMTVFSNVLMQAFNLGVKNPKISSMEILKVVNLFDVKKKKVKHLSLGMKQRLGLAISLLGNPKLLILDEPINGLDPEGIVEFREILQNLNKEGVTIFISSHLLEELSKIATHYAFINNGRLLEELTAEELLSKRESYLLVKVKEPEKALKILKSELEIKKIIINSKKELQIYDYQDISAINYLLTKNEFRIDEIFTYHQDLEQYYLNLVEDKKNV